jgi:hypothetical protein
MIVVVHHRAPVHLAFAKWRECLKIAAESSACELVSIDVWDDVR